MVGLLVREIDFKFNIDRLRLFVLLFAEACLWRRLPSVATGSRPLWPNAGWPRRILCRLDRAAAVIDGPRPGVG